MNFRHRLRARCAAFARLELIVILALIAVLAGLVFPAIQVSGPHYKPEASAAVHGIVSAIEAYHTEYGYYPLGDETPGHTFTTDVMFGDGTMSNRVVFDILRNIGPSPGAPNPHNPKAIVFFDGAPVRNPQNPRSGFMPPSAGGKYAPGAYIDPWGNEYRIAIDANGDGRITNLPYRDFQGAQAPKVAVAAFSIGKDGVVGSATWGPWYRHASATSDDLVTWLNSAK